MHEPVSFEQQLLICCQFPQKIGIMTREFIPVSYKILQQKLLKEMSLFWKDSRTFSV